MVITSHGPAAGRPVEGSFDDVFDALAGPALALARRVVADDRLAEDVVQEAFLAYWNDRAAFDAARGPFRSWFLTLVHHKAVDAVRRETSQRRRLELATTLERPETVCDVADQVADPRVRTALAALSAVQREALVLAYWGGFTQAEIAVRTGAPLGTVKGRMLGGMRQLQAGLGTAVLAT